MKINYNCKNLLFLTNSKNTKKISKYFKIAYQEDPETALKVIQDAKCQYPAACNAVETLLINDKFKWTVDLLAHLKNNGIELIEKPTTYAYEYGEKKLALRTVISTDEAIFHINKFGSHHTDCIISRDEANIAKFMNEVDSAGVYANVSKITGSG